MNDGGIGLERKYFFGASLQEKSAKRSSGSNKQIGKRREIKPPKQKPASASEIKKIKLHRSKDYKFGDASVLGGEISPASSNSWLRHLSSQQIANIVFPSSENELFEQWLAINFSNVDNDEQKKSLRAFFDSVVAKYGKILGEIQYGSGVEELVYALDSSPGFRWCVGQFGCPSFAGFSDKGGPAALYDPSFNIIAINTNESVVSRSDEKYTTPKDADVVDYSTNSSIIHEWGHWLHNMAIRDTEFLGSPNSRIRNFFGETGTKQYRDALSIADKYEEMGKTEFLGTDLNAKSGTPAVASYFGHINGKEMLPEAISAYLHPNTSISFSSLSDTLRADVEKFLMLSGGKRPWSDWSEIEKSLSRKTK